MMGPTGAICGQADPGFAGRALTVCGREIKFVVLVHPWVPLSAF